MDIVASIIKLLAQQSSVEVPTLGTWTQAKVPGKFDTTQQAFLPPSFLIKFHKLENGDDSLAQFIHKEKQISLKEANTLILNFAQQALQQITEQKEADLSPLGRLRLDNNELKFVENNDFSSPNQFFGLPKLKTSATTPIVEIKVQEIEEVKEAQKIPEVQKAEPIVEEKPEISEAEVWKPTVNQKYEYDPADDEDDEYPNGKKSIWSWIAYILLTLAILFSLAYIFYPRYIEDVIRKFNPPSYEIENENLIDTPKYAVDDLLIADSLKTDSILKSLEVDSVVASQVATYEIIGGAMRTESKAEEIIANYAKRGIEAKKLLNTGGRLIKVSIGSYTEYNEANRVKDSLKKVLKNPDLYIQTVKPNN